MDDLKRRREEPAQNATNIPQDDKDSMILYAALLQELDSVTTPKYFTQITFEDIMKYLELRLEITRELLALRELEFSYKLDEAKQQDKINYKRRRYEIDKPQF